MIRTRATTGRPSVASGHRARAVRELARAEGRRSIRHPAFLAGVALLLPLVLVAAEPSEMNTQYAVVVAAAASMIAAGTFVAVHLAATRPRREQAIELLTAASLPQAHRTTARLLATVWPALASLPVLAIILVWWRVWEGLPILMPEGPTMVTPSWSELLQTPASVVVLGAAAVAIATWAPGRALRFLLPAAVFVGASQLLGPMLIWWGPTGDWRWFLPLAHDFDVRLLGDSRIVLAVQRAAMAWHLIYLIGVALLLAATSLAKHASRRRIAQIASAGVGFAAVGGSLQVLVS